MANARDCGTFWATVQRADSGYLGEFSGYTALLSRVIESQWQNVEIVSIRDRVQSGTGDEGWTVHVDGSLRYKGRVVVPQLTDLR